MFKTVKYKTQNFRKLLYMNFNFYVIVMEILSVKELMYDVSVAVYKKLVKVFSFLFFEYKKESK